MNDVLVLGDCSSELNDFEVFSLESRLNRKQNDPKKHRRHCNRHHPIGTELLVHAVEQSLHHPNIHSIYDVMGDGFNALRIVQLGDASDERIMIVQVKAS